MRSLARQGSNLVVGYHSDQASAEAAAATVREHGREAVLAQGDVSVPSDVSALFYRAESAFGDVDVLVNNAGIARGGPIGDLTDEEIQRVLTVNLRGVLYTCREAANRLADGGRIINLSTGLTNHSEAGFGLYAASKAGVEALTRSLAAEVGDREITANVVQPGPTEPGMFEAASDAAREQRANDSYFGRIGRADEVANIVTILASDAAGWVSGQVICVDGGIMS